jgi:hypothetical protein
MSRDSEVEVGNEWYWVVIGILVLPFSVYLTGWGFHWEWAWFVVPVFPGLPTISTSQGVGLWAIFGSALSAKYDKDKTVLYALLVGILRGPAMYVIGWVIHWAITQ